MLVLLVLLMVPFGPLTALGARRRGNPWAPAAVAGLVFPLTWVYWYVSDELPRSRGRTRVPRLVARIRH